MESPRLHARLPPTHTQRELYKSILLRDPGAVLGGGGGGVPGGGGASAPRLQNLLMHLRKATAHPYLFDGMEDRSLDPMGDHVITNCAKLQASAGGGPTCEWCVCVCRANSP